MKYAAPAALAYSMCMLKYFNPAVKLSLAVLALALVVLLRVEKSTAGNRMENSDVKSAAHKAVLVELFTSEGCSSCPPADQLLGRLRQEMAGKNIEVIPLGFHVDYWNSLGWQDRFSSAEFSRRQEQYALSLKLEGPYTPQMIVDGSTEFVGNNAAHAQSAITAAASEPAQAEIALSLQPADRILLQVKVPPRSGVVNVALAVTEDNLSTKVGAGENNGHELHHAAVVREFRPLGHFSGETYKAEIPLAILKEWKRGDLRAVAFVQQGDSGKVLGAASVSLLAQPR
jgi:hypothetical protein